MIMGTVKEINPVFLCKAKLESGAYVFWVDRTLSPLLQRTLAEEIEMTIDQWGRLNED